MIVLAPEVKHVERQYEKQAFNCISQIRHTSYAEVSQMSYCS